MANKDLVVLHNVMFLAFQPFPKFSWSQGRLERAKPFSLNKFFPNYSALPLVQQIRSGKIPALMYMWLSGKGLFGKQVKDFFIPIISISMCMSRVRLWRSIAANQICSLFWLVRRIIGGFWDIAGLPWTRIFPLCLNVNIDQIPAGLAHFFLCPI